VCSGWEQVAWCGGCVLNDLAHPRTTPPQATGYGGTVAGAKTVEEKLKRRQEQPNVDLEKWVAVLGVHLHPHLSCLRPPRTVHSSSHHFYSTSAALPVHTHPSNASSTPPCHHRHAVCCRAAANREVTVWFNTDVADDMPWEFKPTQEYVRVKAGQSTLAFFTAHNKRWGSRWWQGLGILMCLYVPLAH